MGHFYALVDFKCDIFLDFDDFASSKKKLAKQNMQ